MSDKLTQNLTEATVVDTAADRIPIYSAASPSELRYMTPANLVPDASTTVKGKVELATDAETVTGTDTARAITPSNYKNAFDETLPAVTNAATTKSTPVDADELPIVDSAASNVLKKLTWANLKATLKTYFDTLYTALTTVDGWQSVSDTWTYASASTITVPSGAASLYQVGDKIKITQTTAKYFYIVAVADTLLTVTAGSDYTVANAAITSPYYSHVENPVGFPGNFNFAPTRAVSAGTVPTYTAIDISYFNIKGNILFGVISWVNLAGGTAGAGGNNLTFSLPVACKAADFSGDRSHLGFGNSFESAGTIASVGVVGASSASTAELITSSAGAAIKGDDQSSTNRYINASLQYRIA